MSDKENFKIVNKIELTELEVIIQNKIAEYCYKHKERPKYLKVPLWIFECMKQTHNKMMFMRLNYQTEKFEYDGLIICETISIAEPEEIEVF